MNSNKEPHKIIIIWDDEGVAVADAKAMDYVLSKIDNGEREIVVSTCTMLDACRVLHLRGKIEMDYIRWVGDKAKNYAKEQFGQSSPGECNVWNIYVSNDARLSRWPTGFCDDQDNYISEIAFGKEK